MKQARTYRYPSIVSALTLMFLCVGTQHMVGQLSASWQMTDIGYQPQGKEWEGLFSVELRQGGVIVPQYPSYVYTWFRRLKPSLTWTSSSQSGPGPARIGHNTAETWEYFVRVRLDTEEVETPVYSHHPPVPGFGREIQVWATLESGAGAEGAVIRFEAYEPSDGWNSWKEVPASMGGPLQRAVIPGEWTRFHVRPDLLTSAGQKFHHWSTDLPFVQYDRNHDQVLANVELHSLVARYRNILTDVTVRIVVDSLSADSLGSFGFSDPWLVDTSDAGSLDGAFGHRNYGPDAPLRVERSPLHLNSSSPHHGVFRNQLVQPGTPYYAVLIPKRQSIPALGGDVVWAGFSYDVRLFAVSVLADSPSVIIAGIRFKEDGGVLNLRYSTASPGSEPAPAAAGIVPEELWTLNQNYPNPFNGSTVIGYRGLGTGFESQVPNPASISLRIYDVLGREVAVLVEGSVSAGEREVVWDPRGLPSGMYIARMSVRMPGGGVESRSIRMHYLK